MIVVAIIGILATIAFPSYQNFVVKSRRADAKAMLQQVASWMERNQVATYRYDKDVSGADIGNTTLNNLGYGKTPSGGGTTHYLIQFAGTVGANSYVVAAIPQGGQATSDAACGTLAISSNGLRGQLDGANVITNPTSEDCWQR